MSHISLLIAFNFLCKYKYESQLYFSLHTNTITKLITTDYKLQITIKILLHSYLPSPHNKEVLMKIMDSTNIILYIMLIQTIRMEIQPCANSMWTESIINNCYTSHMEQVEGHARLSLWMTLQKPYIFASHCQCHPSESEKVLLWRNLMLCLLLSLAILDESIKTLSNHFNKIKQLLEQKQTSNVAFRESKTNLHQINKLHKRFT